MKFKLGLTGSMGMGKTSTAFLFEKYNCGIEINNGKLAVWNCRGGNPKS